MEHSQMDRTCMKEKAEVKRIIGMALSRLSALDCQLPQVKKIAGINSLLLLSFIITNINQNDFNLFCYWFIVFVQRC